MINFIEAAAHYVALGFKVIPLKPRSKEPMTKHGVHDATDDADVLGEWARQSPDANIAVGCGPASGITAIDEDKHKGGDESLKALEAKHGELPPHPISQTPQGGYHHYFAHDPRIGNSVEALAKGLDVKSKGGYVVLPPSYWDGHKKGEKVAEPGIYTWKRAPLGSHMPPMPPWLTKLLLPKPQSKLLRKSWDTSNIDLVQIDKDLKSVSSHDYWTWVRIGMALKLEFGDAAYGVWCNWSSRYSGFSEKECAQKWKSFKRTGGNCVRIGTILRELKQGGANLNGIINRGGF
jgi:hypothetical protein